MKSLSRGKRYAMAWVLLMFRKSYTRQTEGARTVEIVATRTNGIKAETDLQRRGRKRCVGGVVQLTSATAGGQARRRGGRGGDLGHAS